MNRVWVCVGLLTLVWLFNFAGSSKPKLTFRVHLQTDGQGLTEKQAFPIQLNSPSERIFVKSMAELNEHDILDVVGWPSDDLGQGMAVRIHFTRHGTTVLSDLTLEAQGRIMVVIVNGRVIYAPIIDTAINTGILTIPRGILPAEYDQLLAVAKENNR